MWKSIGSVVTGLVIAMGIGASTTTADAADKVDCSKLAKFQDRHTYKKGDLVVWTFGGNAASEYRCKDGYCSENPGMSGWEKVSECRAGTEPK